MAFTHGLGGGARRTRMNCGRLTANSKPKLSAAPVVTFVTAPPLARRYVGGTLFVAVRGQTLIGCGGWSLRVPNPAAHVQPGALLLRPAPRVRSLYVHPSFARLGVGRALLVAIEQDIAAAGHDCAFLSATLNSTGFFRAQGYHGRKAIMLRLPQTRTFSVLAMGKWLAAAETAAA